MSIVVGGSGVFRVGDVLSRAWTLLNANFLFFIAVSFIVYGGVIVVVFVVVLLTVAAGQLGGRAAVQPAVIIMMIVVGLFAFAALMASQAALLYGAFQYLRGLPPRVGESLRRAFGRILPLVGLGLLSGLAIWLGLLALLVPGFILLCMWFVAVPACVVEGLGPAASMSRSAALTKGYRWQVFGIFVLIYGGWVIANQLVKLLLMPVSPVLAAIAAVVVPTLVTLYGYCAVIMTYHDLRVAKEGVDTTQIASVFD